LLAGMNGSSAGHSGGGYRVEESDKSRSYSPHLRSILSRSCSCPQGQPASSDCVTEAKVVDIVAKLPSFLQLTTQAP
jgi:hypothetical protein